ncbi:MAG: hypothetical protein RLZZ600_305 [Actinomycetota bacterium]|jgi:uncharacterized RDD family membrane protein YckC
MSARDDQKTGSSPAPSKYPGERLGLPSQGKRSVARFGRRFIALLIDWTIATIAANLLTGSWDASTNARPAHQILVYGIWVALMIVEVPIFGGTIGHRICAVAVTPLRGGWPGLWRPLVRALLLALLVPALVWDSDSRAFHDKVAGTVLVRT